ncbi:putative ribonuclease H-like domain-containing protein, partial [Tanacetum coccineum]
MGMRRGGVGTRRFYLVGKGVTKVLRCCGGDKVVMEVLSKVELILLLSYLLKIGEYSCGVLMNKQYFQVQDYALWEVIENVSTMMLNNVCAIETRFGGNEATKKTQKTLLKEQHENFSASSTESLDSIFNRLQKIIEKFDNASKSLNKLLRSQITDKSKKGLGYNVVPPPHPLIYNRPKKLDFSYSALVEFKEPEFKSYGSEDSKNKVLEDTSSFVESSLNVEKETVFLNKKIEFVKPKNHEKPVKKSVRLSVNTIKGKGCFDMKNIVLKEGLTYLVAKATLDESIEKCIKREYSVARTPHQNSVAERRNRTLIEAARTIGFKPALSFMRPFGCHVTILNTLDNLGKFDGKSDKSFFVGYSLSSKAFRVYTTRTMRVEENLHIGFLENKPMIEGNGPKWLFDIDSLTQSMNYVPVAADATYFYSPSKDVGNGEPKSAADDQKQVEDGPHNESDKKISLKRIAVLRKLMLLDNILILPVL